MSTGIVEEVGSDVRMIKPGQFVIGSFWASDNACEICRAGYRSSCIRRVGIEGAQAELMWIPLADGTLVAAPDVCRRSHPEHPRRLRRARPWRAIERSSLSPHDPDGNRNEQPTCSR
jgi:hypothetical protein